MNIETHREYTYQVRGGNFAPTKGLIKVDNITTMEVEEDGTYTTCVSIKGVETILWFKLYPTIFDIKRRMMDKTKYYFEVKYHTTNGAELYYKG